MTCQAFISYARLDNEVPRGVERLSGFVSVFRDYLDHELKQLPKPRPRLWLDTANIERGDQFDIMLDEQVAQSDFMIVIFSHNWLDRPYCKREINRFSERWAAEGEAGVKQRILLVNKTPVDRGLRPPLLQGQEGHDFFAIDQEQHQGAQVRPFFDVGEIQDNRFIGQVRELASKLQRLAASRTPQPAAIHDHRAAAQTTGRTIFVARPADDMRAAYDRIVNELKGRGFAVLPETEIPNDDTAVGLINRSLAVAEFSVHALGEKRGFAPPEQEPIVRLQLALAAARAGQGAGAAAPAFHRVIWAPKIVENGTEAGSAAPSLAAQRDPLEVLAKFDAFIESDKVLGDNLSRFIDFLARHLDQTAPRRVAVAAPISPGRSVYIDHHRDDIDYATEVAEALEQRAIQPVIPVLDGKSQAEIDAVNRKLQKACDAVALCWATATEVWAMAHASRLDEWRRRARKQGFASALLLGPPGDPIKARRARIKPREVDCVIDLTNHDKPSARDLDSWLGPASPEASRPPVQG